MQLAGKTISAIFLGVKNTFQFTREGSLCDDKQAPSILVNFKLIVRCFLKFFVECSQKYTKFKNIFCYATPHPRSRWVFFYETLQGRSSGEYSQIHR